MNRGNLKTGFTTGTSAAAAAKAAILSIIRQEGISTVSVRLPGGDYADIPIKSCRFGNDTARCSVIKNAGDDPDVTHGAEIVVDLSLNSSGGILIDGGTGVGTVTKPGLGLEIGKPAINPVPKRMIVENLTEAAGSLLEKTGVTVTVSVPAGAELGPKTDNPRIGIVDGISILGTSGIVIPFSTASYAASIRQNIDVAVAMGNDTLVLATGGRSEDFAKRIVSLPDHCFVQMGDFSGYTIRQCAKKSIDKAYVVGFIGKLTKMAAGVRQTHVKGSKVDMAFLAGLAGQCGASSDIMDRIKTANTARHVSEIILKNKIAGFFELVCQEVHAHMQKHAESRIGVEVILFDFDGSILARTSE